MMSWSPFLRQCFVAGAPLFAATSAGGATVYPSALLQQLKSNETSIHLDFEASTWIGSVQGLAGIPSIFMPSLMQWRGRKFALISACLILTSGWIIAFSANSIGLLLLSECLQGLGSNSIMTVSFMSISEMVSPKYRATLLQTYLLCQTLTMSFCGIVFQYLYWKTAAAVMLIPTFIALAIAIKWPESPYWLAYKGKIDQCKKAFTWLRGSDSEAKMELENLICKQREHFINKSNKKKTELSFKRLRSIVTDKGFYVPAFHMFILDCIIYWSGIMVMIIYSSEIFARSTQNETAREYSVPIVQTCTSVGVACSIFFDKIVRKKTLLLSGSGIVIICLLSASLITYLQSIERYPKDSWLPILFLVIYTFVLSFCVVCTSYPILSSLMPVKYRGIGGALMIINTSILHSSSLKFSPYLLAYINIYGLFLVYALNSIVCCFIVWKYVPQTDGKTLQDIEDFYVSGAFICNEEESSKNYELVDVSPDGDNDKE